MTAPFSSVHPVADLFPMLPDDELKDLADDIKTNGLQQPVVVSDGVLIDGRNRLAACEMVDVEPDFVELNGSDPVAFILSANLARRHMTKGQRAMAGVRAYGNKVANRQTARVSGVNREYVNRASRVLDADSDLADQVLAGAISLNEAYGIISDRRKDVERLAAKREQLRTMAPDLDDQVSEEVLQLSEALETARQRDAEHQSRLRTAQANLTSVLTYLTSDSISPQTLADQDYGETAGQFPLDRLRYAAETMQSIADLGETND